MEQQRAIVDVITQYEAIVRSVIRKYAHSEQDIEDAYQEFVVKVLKNFNQLRDDRKIKSWLCRIAANTIKSFYRGWAVNNILLVEKYFGEPAAENISPDQKIEAEVMTRRVKEAAEELPPRQKQAFCLRIFDEMDFRSIAELQNCRYDTAKANFRHGMVKVKKLLAA